MTKPEPIKLDKWDNLARAQVERTDTELITELVRKFNQLLEYIA